MKYDGFADMTAPNFAVFTANNDGSALVATDEI